MINFVCVYHKNKKTPYSHDYVLKLKNMIARNYIKPHRFHCLSNVDIPIEKMFYDLDYILYKPWPRDRAYIHKDVSYE